MIFRNIFLPCIICFKIIIAPIILILENIVKIIEDEVDDKKTGEGV